MLESLAKCVSTWLRGVSALTDIPCACLLVRRGLFIFNEVRSLATLVISRNSLIWNIVPSGVDISPARRLKLKEAICWCEAAVLLYLMLLGLRIMEESNVKYRVSDRPRGKPKFGISLKHLHCRKTWNLSSLTCEISDTRASSITLDKMSSMSMVAGDIWKQSHISIIPNVFLLARVPLLFRRWITYLIAYCYSLRVKSSLGNVVRNYFVRLLNIVIS